MEEPRRGYIGNVLKESEQVRAREKEADPSHGCQLLSKRNYRHLPGRGLLCLVRRGQGQQGRSRVALALSCAYSSALSSHTGMLRTAQ